MTPYYEDDAVTIYHGDCRDVLPCVGPVDSLIPDPPYGVGLTARRARNKGGGSHEIAPAATLYRDDPEYVMALVREVIPLVLSLVKRALIFSGTSMLMNYPQPRAIGSVNLPAGCGYTPWGFQTSQPILYYGACPFLEHGVGNRPNGFTPSKAYPSATFDHPCPKPLEWMTWAVARASWVGETIIDPFAGTGTTLRAAKDLGRNAIGIEAEERYCEIAAKRMAQEVLDLDA